MRMPSRWHMQLALYRCLSSGLLVRRFLPVVPLALFGVHTTTDHKIVFGQTPVFSECFPIQDLALLHKHIQHNMQQR